MSKKSYRKSGNQIFYGNEDEEKLVARIDADGNPLFEPGMIGPHKRKLADWLASPDDSPVIPAVSEPEPEPEPEPVPPIPPLMPDGGNTNVFIGTVLPPDSGSAENRSDPVPEGEPETAADWQVSTIPANELPDFSPEFGMDTPGLRDYIKKHRLTPEQVSALVKRMERKG